MSKLLNVVSEVVKRVRTERSERDPVAGRTTKRTDPPTHRVDRGVTVEYSPEIDGDADPGEVVWAWVPFEEDPNRGKDRPVVIIGRTVGERRELLAGVPLTSKNKGRADHVPVGTGGWDPKRRDSWAKVDRLLKIDPDDVRREGDVLARNRFDEVVVSVAKHHDLVRR